MANSVDPDQAMLFFGIWSGCALFAQGCLSKYFTWAMPCKKCLRAYEDSENPDQLAHPCSLIWAFAFRKQNHWILLNVSVESKCRMEWICTVCTCSEAWHWIIIVIFAYFRFFCRNLPRYIPVFCIYSGWSQQWYWISTVFIHKHCTSYI